MNMAIFLATLFSPNGTVLKEGSFHQLGSSCGALCIQGQLDHAFPPIKGNSQWKILSGLFMYYGRSLSISCKCDGGIIELPNGRILMIERGKEDDQRYGSSAIADEYKNFFGAAALKNHINSKTVPGVSRKTYVQQHTATMNKVFTKATTCSFHYLAVLC
jgi:hypothetical protein